MSSSPVQKFLSPGTPVEFLGFAIVNAMLGLFGAGNRIGLVFVPVFAIAWWLFDGWRKQQLQDKIAYSLEKQPPQPARGLILLVSPYNPFSPLLKDAEVLGPRVAQLLQNPQPTQADFDAINLLKSNLAPQINAIAYHSQQQTLREVWLIVTASYETVQGSEVAAQILQKYLRWRFGSQFDLIVEGPIREYDYHGFWQVAEAIFRKSGYKDRELVADITGGNKMMSVALAMACIPPGRRMQYMDSQRDWQGNPLNQGDMQPVGIDVDSILYSDGNR